MTNTEKTVKLWCEQGEHHWERVSQRGKRPKSCPEHKPQPVRETEELTPEQLEAKKAASQAKRAETNAAKAEREAAEQLEREKSEFEKLQTSIASLYETYEESLSKAIKSNKPEDWAVVERRQSRAITGSVRLNALARKLEEANA